MACRGEHERAIPEGPPIGILAVCHSGNLGTPRGRMRAVNSKLRLRDFHQAVIGNPANDIVRLRPIPRLGSRRIGYVRPDKRNARGHDCVAIQRFGGI